MRSSRTKYLNALERHEQLVRAIATRKYEIATIFGRVNSKPRIKNLERKLERLEHEQTKSKEIIDKYEKERDNHNKKYSGLIKWLTI